MASGRFTDVNDAFLKTLGYSREEILGKTSADLGLFARVEEQQEVTEELLRGGRFVDRELEVICKDGSQRDVLFSGEIIRGQEKESILTVMVDITGLKRRA